MNKEAFIGLLKTRLNDLPYDEVQRIIDYYDEYIMEAVDSGKNEEEVISSFGDIDILINKLRTEQQIEAAKKKPTVSNGIKVLIAVLGVLSIPIAIPFVIALISVVIALIGVLIGIIAGVISLIVFVIYLFIQSFAVMGTDKAAAFLMMGGSLFGAGVLTFFVLGFTMLIRAIIKGFIYLMQKIYDRVTKKGSAAV